MKTARSKTNRQQEQDDFFLGDFGDFGEIDFDFEDVFDIGGEEYSEETRYIKPKLYTYDEHKFVLYDNAVKLAKDLRITNGMRADAFVAGNFIFGDFIEAFLTTHYCRAERMTISTLSLSQENIDSLRTLLEKDYIGELNLIISAYFYGHERNALVPYTYQQLDIDNRFQLAVAGMHTKTVHFETLGGKKICIHGSANLRSSGNIEQFTIEENPALYEFYEEHFQKVLDKYQTIRKPIRNKAAWDTFTKKQFKD